MQDNNSALKNLSAIVDFANLINSSLDLDFALNNLLLTCLAKFQTTKGLVLIANDKNQLEIKGRKGLTREVRENFPELNIQTFENDKAFNNFITRFEFTLYEKIYTSEKLLGVLLLGKKLTGKEYTPGDKQFLKTLVNIGSTAIANSLSFKKLKELNRTLDSKVNQLSSLFDLSKEFSGILDEERVSKLLVYSVIAQMLVSKFAVLSCNNKEVKILETRFPKPKLQSILPDCLLIHKKEPVYEAQIKKEYPALWNIGVVLIIPMIIKDETKGMILLGKRLNNLSYSYSDVEFISSAGSLAIISIENARLFKEAIEKQKIEKDLEIAKDIQKNLLPKHIPQSGSYEISAYNKTARQVGGDYYNVIKLGENKVLVAVGDVSGKGVQAALLMANLQAFLKSIIKQNLPMVDASNLLNDLVSENTLSGSFITFFWGIYDEVSRKFEYVNAGHNPPLLVRDGKLTKLKRGGMILGVMKTTVPYQSEIVNIKENDVLIIFTDGITEAMNLNNEEFSDEKLEELAVRTNHKSAQDIMNNLIDSVNEHTWGAEQSDDITCIVMKFK